MANDWAVSIALDAPEKATLICRPGAAQSPAVRTLSSKNASAENL
jgi:hypothetical protein